MRPVRTAVHLRGALAACLGLGLIVLSSGCTHNHYYTTANPCAPSQAMVVPGAVAAGSVCEVPAGGTVVAGGRVVDGPVIISSAPTPKVITSQPGARSPGRFSWHAADPEGGMMTTKVEGAVDSPTLTR